MACKHPGTFKSKVNDEILQYIREWLIDRRVAHKTAVYVLGQQLGVAARAFRVCPKCGAAKAVRELKPTIRVVSLPNELSAMKETGELTAKLSEALEILDRRIATDTQNQTGLTTIKHFVVPALRGARALEGKDV